MFIPGITKFQRAHKKNQTLYAFYAREAESVVTAIY